MKKAEYKGISGFIRQHDGKEALEIWIGMKSQSKRREKAINFTIRQNVEMKRACEKWQTDDGYIHLLWDQMDCDCAQWTSRYRVRANPTSLKRHIMAMYDGAEGPIHYSYVSKRVYDKFEPQRRDRALEAFEDGHPHSVSYGSLI